MRFMFVINLLGKLKLVPVVFFVVLGLYCSTASAQTFFGTIVGTSTDVTGAVVVGATVTVTNLGTSDTRVVKTDSAGDYRFVNLPPGNYKVLVESNTFKRFLQQPVEVTVDTTTRVNAALEIGASSETVEVSAQAALLQSETGSLGDTIDAKQIDAMPLNGRNPMNLMELVPGVIPQGGTGGASMNDGGTTGSVGWGNYQIGGGLPTQSSTYIDGAPVVIMQKNTQVLIPTQDTVQEFKVETSGISAEFGRFGGGVVNMVTKSGANRLHGTAYEYIRNKDVNANGFFFKRSGLPTPEYTENQYGGTVSGPVWRDRLFFFGAYEKVAIRQGALAQTNIPTQSLQAGIFATKIGTAAGTDLQGICSIQPYTGQAITGVPGVKDGSTFAPGGYYIANLYQPGLKAGTTCGDPTAKILKQFYSYSPVNPSSQYNFNETYSIGDDSHQTVGRVDYVLSPKQRVFARGTLWGLADESPNPLHNANGYNTSGQTSHNHTNQIVAGDTYTFNATTVLDVRADYLRQYGDSIAPSFNTANEATYGAPFAALAPYMTYHQIPSFSLAGTGSIHNIFNFGYAGVSIIYYNGYHISGGLTKILGKHTLKMGAEGRLMQREDIGAGGNSGAFTYGGDLNGDEWANFLLGAFDSGSLTTVKGTTSYDFYHGYYLMDTWQVRPKLTVTLGARLEWPGAVAEARNNASVLLPNTVDPYTGIKGTVGLVASNLYSARTTQQVPSPKFGPRVGFAYRLTNDTVFRGGYTLSYLTPDYQTGTYAANQPINSATTTNTNTNGVVGYTMGINPFPATAQYPVGIQTPPQRSNPAFMVANIGQTVSAPYPFEPYPTSESMNLSLGHQFKGDFLVDVGVTHALGYHLPRLSDGLDQLPNQYFSMGSALAAKPATPLVYDAITLATSLQTVGQSLRPFPAYKNYSNSSDFNGTTSYNALEVKVQKRFKAVGQFGVAYTWMKMIGDADSILTGQESVSSGVVGAGHGTYQDYNNLKGERSIYSFDAPNRLVINYVYNLPFGHGQRFGANTNGVTDRVISGWSLSGITTFQSGYPVYLYTSGNNLSKNFGAGTIRPNYTPGCNKTVGGSPFARTLPGATWFNTTCFTLPNTPGVAGPGTSASYGFGNEARTDDAIKSAGADNFDISAIKAIPIRDQISFQFRVECFNLFNRTQFGPPVTEVDAPNNLFGVVSNTANQPRTLQGALRLNF